MRVAWRSVGQILERVADEQRANVDLLDGLRRIGIDEISHRKGQRYLTVVVDHHSGRLVWAAPGRDSTTVLAFFDALGEERCQALELISADMASWISVAIAERAPQAERCVDPFHVVMLATDALDQVRREVWNEARRQGNMQLARDLKGARFAVWKNPENLTDRQQTKLATIQQTNAKLYRAYLLKEQLRQIYQLPAAAAEQLLDRWLVWARRCRLPSFVKLARTIGEQRDGILAAIRHRLSNECLSYCTSWCGCGGDAVRGGAGAMMAGSGGGVAGRGLGASAAVQRPGLAGVVEVFAAAVDPPAGDLPAALPDLDRLTGDAELCGDLLECEHARSSQALVVRRDAAVAA
jgi:transposase